ncbi:DUF4145 domain-containing protein [Mesorhizobium sp. B2-3-10]|uniref:DUF4145 domain-containing protein n=1 Tax=Mesorhizobium sp. B2-3-10 TaxID=2589954 RepID=UPI0015E29708|nr:DUF4145 domain-containing protein [Mesorhizobium sp. B2-3-10]
MSGKYVPPSVNLTAFNCPHCSALAKQFWHVASCSPLNKDQSPRIWSRDNVSTFDFSKVDKENIGALKKKLAELATGMPFLDENRNYKSLDILNLHLSRCFNCDKISIWIYNRMVWPAATEAPEPNLDLPDDVRADYDEAGLVLNTSPRSAAALLRQAVQRLCVHLGENGKNIDADIASLVKKGLDPRIQKALDVVRVVGNNAVHPGQIDLKDDRATAEKLFGLVNLVADVLISQPKHINAMFDGLPDRAKQAIEKRDAPKQIEDKSAG